MRFKIITILINSLLMAQKLIAESWSENTAYHAGNIVDFNEKFYMASYWNKGMQPIDNKVAWDGWISIKNNTLPLWKANKAYQPGSVIKYNEQNYISKWWNENALPEQDKTSWAKLSIATGIKYEADEQDNILGIDKDSNGIRDSYEFFIEKKYNDPVIKSYLKSAAREYQKVLELHLNPDIAGSLTNEQATQIMKNLVTFMFCNRKLRKEGRLPLNSSPISEYYNTVERAIARHKGGIVLYKKNIDESFNPYNEPNACGSLIK